MKHIPGGVSIVFSHVPAMYRFYSNGEEYVKVCNAFSVNQRTGKDAIFSLHEKVEVHGLRAYACRID
jgi:hypothetical protein